MAIEPEKLLHPDRDGGTTLSLVVDWKARACRRDEMGWQHVVDPPPDVKGQQAIESRGEHRGVDVVEPGNAVRDRRKPVFERHLERAVGEVRKGAAGGPSQEGRAAAKRTLLLRPAEAIDANGSHAVEECADGFRPRGRRDRVIVKDEGVEPALAACPHAARGAVELHRDGLAHVGAEQRLDRRAVDWRGKTNT